MRICELFPSIQGESTLQGIPTVFVRLTGCNLDCRYCDTRYAREGGEHLTTEQILQSVHAFDISHVCITGGEPLVQEETPHLAETLTENGYTVSVETNGSIDASSLPESVIRVIDIKTPGSGESGSTFMKNIKDHRPRDEYKFVITDRGDFDYSVAFARKHFAEETPNMLFSPAYGMIDPATLSDWILKEYPMARLNLQLHKYIWPQDIGTHTPR